MPIRKTLSPSKSTHQFRRSRNKKTRDVVERALNDRRVALVEHGLLKKLDLRTNVMMKVLDRSEGQDKTFKMISSLLWVIRHWVLKITDRFSICKEIALRLESVARSTSFARKFMRLYQTIVFFRLTMELAFNEEKFTVMKCLVLGRLTGLVLYFVGNCLEWADMTGLLRRAPGSTSFVSFSLKSVLFSLFFSFLIDGERIIRGLSFLHYLKKDRKKLVKELNDYTQHMKNMKNDKDVNRYLSQMINSPIGDGEQFRSELLSRTISMDFAPSMHNNSNDSWNTTSMGSGLTAGLGMNAGETVESWYKEHLRNLKAQLNKTDRKIQEQWDSGFVLSQTILKNTMDVMNACNYLLQWGWSKHTTSLIDFSSSFLSVRRLFWRTLLAEEKKARLEKCCC